MAFFSFLCEMSRIEPLMMRRWTLSEVEKMEPILRLLLPWKYLSTFFLKTNSCPVRMSSTLTCHLHWIVLSLSLSLSLQRATSSQRRCLCMGGTLDFERWRWKDSHDYLSVFFRYLVRNFAHRERERERERESSAEKIHPTELHASGGRGRVSKGNLLLVWRLSFI